ncbi:MAG: hypothetical protein R3B49_05265 [Phycisphaerales bacterium]
MARPHEHQGKALLAEPRAGDAEGRVARTPDDKPRRRPRARRARGREDPGPTTGLQGDGGRAGRHAGGGRAAAERMLRLKVGNFPVEMVLVEEQSASPASCSFR